MLTPADELEFCLQRLICNAIIQMHVRTDQRVCCSVTEALASSDKVLLHLGALEPTPLLARLNRLDEFLTGVLQRCYFADSGPHLVAQDLLGESGVLQHAFTLLRMQQR